MSRFVGLFSRVKTFSTFTQIWCFGFTQNHALSQLALTSCRLKLNVLQFDSHSDGFSTCIAVILPPFPPDETQRRLRFQKTGIFVCNGVFMCLLHSLRCPSWLCKNVVFLPPCRLKLNVLEDGAKTIWPRNSPYKVELHHHYILLTRFLVATSYLVSDISMNHGNRASKSNSNWEAPTRLIQMS